LAIANLVVPLEPFLPFSSAKVRGWLAVDSAWSPKTVLAGFVIPEPEILFERLDKTVADEELLRLQAR
jgi:methionyl-tRNA synthetase